jgi:type II secretion system protein G
MKSMRSNRGFTLIELLVVVAIIGLLASIVIASLNSARIKGRDARRVADIKQISLALEMYNDANSQYPIIDSAANLGSYLASIPTDPKTPATAYLYASLQGSATNPVCGSYHLGTTLEQVGSASLSSKAGKSNATGAYPAFDGVVCTGSAADFDGTVATAPQVFDIRP